MTEKYFPKKGKRRAARTHRNCCRAQQAKNAKEIAAVLLTRSAYIGDRDDKLGDYIAQLARDAANRNPT